MLLLPCLWSFSSLCARTSRPGKTFSECWENAASMDITSWKRPCCGQSFTIRILPSCSMICALISPGLSSVRAESGFLPSRISWRISGTHFGHRESVVRGQPSWGLVFSQDLSSGLSDHLGLNEGFGLIRFNLSNTTQTALAAQERALSMYFAGL